jgi:hypothetical protein
MNWKNLLESVSESVNDELRLRNEYLVAENRILRNQIDGRVQLTDSERKELAQIGAKLGKQALAEIATIAQADTILAWNRQFVDQKVNPSEPPKSVGRPRIDKEIEDLVIRMARENRSWGYDRMQGALNHLGYTISDQTVGNILKRHGMPPAPERQKTVTWREFIRSHWAVFVATGFFNSNIWSWFGLMLSCLLGFIDGCWCHIRSVGTGLYRYVQQMPSLTRCTLHVDGHVKRGSRWIEAVVVSETARLSEGTTGHGMALTVDTERQAQSLAMGKVLFLSVARPRPIRDGPAPPRRQLGERQLSSDPAAA